ncbi:MAG: hypothetical protein LC795_05845 [Acidobacteria bacterium]|nr:hypothetical protein [Acidobacteriota bacterium]
MGRILRIIAFAGCLASTAAIPAKSGGGAAGARVQCPRADRVIPKTIRFGRGRTTAVIKDTVRLCTSHEYTLRARAGQTMSVNLAAGNRTGLTLMSPSGEPLLDGGKDWSGDLPEDGRYTLQIGTDATAAYTLEVTIR